MVMEARAWVMDQAHIPRGGDTQEQDQGLPLHCVSRMPEQGGSEKGGCRRAVLVAFVSDVGTADLVALSSFKSWHGPPPHPLDSTAPEAAWVPFLQRFLLCRRQLSVSRSQLWVL